jgi:hypothetical protein
MPLGAAVRQCPVSACCDLWGKVLTYALSGSYSDADAMSGARWRAKRQIRWDLSSRPDEMIRAPLADKLGGVMRLRNAEGRRTPPKLHRACRH